MIVDEIVSTNGVKLSFFEEFTNKYDCVGMTTGEVCAKYIIPGTIQKKESFCENLLRENPPAIAKANVFISHAWGSKFLDIVEALESHFRDKDLDKVVIWMDIFSHSQHDTATLSYEWWSTTFRHMIESIGHTIVILAPWKDPVPLTRAWCLWEIYCTISCPTCRFEIALSTKEQVELFDNKSENIQSRIENMLSLVDVKRSKCFKDTDKVAIFTAIEATIGFDELNKTILQGLKEWILRTVIKSPSPDRNNVISVLKLFGHGEKVFILCNKLLRQNVKERGIVDLYTAWYLHEMGWIKADMYEFELAKAFCISSILIMQQLMNDKKIDSARTQEISAFRQTLASVYEQMDEIDKALPLYSQHYQCIRNANGQDHIDTILSKFALSKMLRRYPISERVAEEYSKECRLFLERPENEQHVFGARTIYFSHANNCEAIGNFVEAEKIYKKWHEKLTIKVGDDHPETKSMLCKLIAVYLKQGNEIKARQYGFEDEIKVEDLEDLDLHYIAGFYAHRGNHMKAKDYFKAAFTKTKTSYGDTDEETLKAACSLVSAYLGCNETEEAHALISKYLPIAQECLPEDNQTRQQIEENMRNVLRYA